MAKKITKKSKATTAVGRKTKVLKKTNPKVRNAKRKKATVKKVAAKPSPAVAATVS
jgi:hypothetical protein